MQKRVVYTAAVTLGCDPEGFFTRKGTVIGAERVIPKEGLKNASYASAVVIDGVQAELHVLPTGCRQSMGLYLQACFSEIHKRLKELGDPDLAFSFQSHYEVSREELDSLSPECKILGCQPSLNHYGFEGLGVDVTEFRQRSAGGHLHFGMCEILKPHAAECVPVLDAVLGNFCVMVDRDPYAAERRKVYGRAGEYRLPNYGLEYRTLSNFWLRNYALQSMVMGIGRWALGLCYTSACAAKYGESEACGGYWDPVKVLLGDYVDPRQVQRAINTNDLVLAKENWEGVKRFYADCVDSFSDDNNGLHGPNFRLVDHFLARIEEAGLEYWFKDDPMTHWLTLQAGASVTGFPPTTPFYGWETFLAMAVEQDRAAVRKAA